MTTWLQSIKLSLLNWITLSFIGIAGLLMVLLKARSLELHRAKMALLKAEIDNEIRQDDEAVAKARAAYNQAVKEYEASL